MTTRVAFLTAWAGVSATASHQGCLPNLSRNSGRRAQSTMRCATPCARAARATEPPIRPGARMVSWARAAMTGQKRKILAQCRALRQVRAPRDRVAFSLRTIFFGGVTPYVPTWKERGEEARPYVLPAVAGFVVLVLVGWLVWHEWLPRELTAR